MQRPTTHHRGKWLEEVSFTLIFELPHDLPVVTEFQFGVVSYKSRRWPRASSQIEKETLALCYRRVGHRADQYRRARWPALRSQTFEVSYESYGVLS